MKPTLPRCLAAAQHHVGAQLNTCAPASVARGEHGHQPRWPKIRQMRTREQTRGVEGDCSHLRLELALRPQAAEVHRQRTDAAQDEHHLPEATEGGESRGSRADATAPGRALASASSMKMSPSDIFPDARSFKIDLRNPSADERGRLMERQALQAATGLLPCPASHCTWPAPQGVRTAASRE